MAAKGPGPGDFAPVGTEVCCRECDVVVATLNAPIRRYDVVRASDVVLLTGQPCEPGVVVVCPRDPRHQGGYVLVRGEKWSLKVGG